ncbi:MFS transporter [Amorphoplanes digitatis]|uniref:MFS family permease n=1 Tax=Actinoplanes digitatis TaxID=1868 RepID=A0A7W7HVR8_9ACTN|nr:MFS transporter [Actinoplanes digitatis]MBB4761655.1 MFS family permease [Actinoplanes digitatis]
MVLRGRHLVNPGRRPRAAMYVAGGVSSFGTQMTMLALPWLVLESTGSAAKTGLVFAVQVLPLALLGFAGGNVLQRLGARRTMLAGDAARAPLVALVPVLHASGGLSLSMLLTLVALIGLAGVPYAAAQRVLALELIGADPRGLTRAYGVLDGIWNAAAFGGPAVAGALIAVIGPSNVLWLDAASYLVSFVVLLTMVPRTAGRSVVPEAARGSWAGLRYLRADRFLGQAVISTVLFGFVLRVLAITLPLLAFTRFGQDARAGGLLVAGSGAGALLGSLLTYLIASRVAPARLARIAMVMIALPLWLLLLPAPPAALVAAVAVSAAAVTVSNAPYAAIVGMRVPSDLLPSVIQTVITVGAIAGPLGLLFAGVLTERAGIGASLFVVAAIATLATVNVLFALTRMDRGSAAPAPERTLGHV